MIGKLELGWREGIRELDWSEGMMGIDSGGEERDEDLEGVRGSERAKEICVGIVSEGEDCEEEDTVDSEGRGGEDEGLRKVEGRNGDDEDAECGGDNVFEDEGRRVVRNEGLRVEGVWESSSEGEE